MRIICYITPAKFAVGLWLLSFNEYLFNSIVMSSDREDRAWRELGSLTNSLIPRLQRPEDCVDGMSGLACRLTSYSTFVPQYSIDSEYLTTLLVGRILPCELTEPTHSSFVNHFNPAGKHQPTDSGVHSPESESPPPPNSADEVVDFFRECEQQLHKLYEFVELYLALVERELRLVTMAPGNGGRKGSSGNGTGDEDEVDERTPLTGQIQGVGDSDAVLTRLQRILYSLGESITTSFSQLDRLVEMHDDSTTSEAGREFMTRHSLTKAKLERRIASNLDTIDSRLTTPAKDDWESVSYSGGGLQVESPITAEVRAYRPGCLALLHVLLFVSALCAMCFMYYYGQEHATWAVAVRLLRSPFLVVFYFYLFGINIKVWANHFIDYVHIFSFPARGTPTPKYAWKVAGIFCVVFTSILGCQLFLSYLEADIPLKASATVMWILLLVFWFNPTNTFLRTGRLTFILVVVRILIAPFHTVYFGDFWFADQLNSLVGILLDMQYYVCYMSIDTWRDPPNKSVCTSSKNGIRPIISALPALWRFMQCLRYFYDERKVKHLINAVKYSTTFPVIVFATLFSVQVPKTFTLESLELHQVGWIILLWGVFSVVHALYTFIWDVYCDWGLLQIQHGTLLRPKRLYSWKSFYCIAIVMDFILRFAWTMKLTLAIVWHIDSDVFYTGLVAAEIFRRYMWNFFRVEYQQILDMEQ